MRTPFLLFLAATCVLTSWAADGPEAKPAAPKSNRAVKGSPPLPPSIEGVSAEAYTQLRQVLPQVMQTEPVLAAQKRIAELRERTRFTAGRQEAEDQRADFEKAREALVKAIMEAVQKIDPNITKDTIALTFNAVEEATKKRGQAAMQKLREKENAEAKLKQAEAPTPKAEIPTVAAEVAKPMTPAQLLADVEGVSAEDMRAFRSAALQAQKDPAVRATKAKQAEMRKQAEYASADEKKGLRGEFEALATDLRKATLVAISKAAPTLAKETLDKIMETVEGRAREAAKKVPAKGTKTPLKPFPFAEKK